MRRALLAGFVAGLLPLAVAAQRAGVAMSGARSSAPVAHAPSAPMASHAAPQVHLGTAMRPGTRYAGSGVRSSTVRRSTPTRPVTTSQPAPSHPSRTTVTFNSYIGGWPPNNSIFGDGYPVPGLGFDFDHFFAVHPGWGRNRFLGGVVLPFVGYGGFYLPVPYYWNEGPDAEMTASTAPPPPAPGPAEQSSAVATEPAPPMASRDYSFPTSAKSVSEFIFVKRDGTRIYAVAYSLTKDNLQYITKEGLRRSVTLDSLDYDATEKSNEERGNTISLPKPLASSDV